MNNYTYDERTVDKHEYGVGEGGYILSRITYYLFGIIETLLAFRLILRLLGAGMGSSFVNFIYGITQPLVNPFWGIFPGVSGPGAVTRAVLEPATLIAMIVYAVVAWAIVRIIEIASHGAHHRHTAHLEENRF